MIARLGVGLAALWTAVFVASTAVAEPPAPPSPIVPPPVQPANIGDQPSDLDGGFSERTFLLPNPFYRIP